MKSLSAALTVSTVALSLAFAPATIAQSKKQQPAATTSGGTSGSVEGRNVSVGAGTTGYATPDGTRVTGTADANAVNGTVETQIDSKANERRAMVKSTATAETEEERARARSRTMVQPNQTIRSRSTTMYKAEGERPVRETVTSITCPDGRVVQKMVGCKR